MRTKNLFAMAALAIALLAGTSARASFNYSVTPGSDFTGGVITNQSATLNAGVAVSATGLDTPTDIIFANPTYSSSATTSENLTFNYNYRITITNTSGGGQTGNFFVSGTISGPGSATSSSLSNLTAAPSPSSLVIGGTTFVVSALPGNPNGTAPQAGSPPTIGSLVVHVDTVSGPPVPEPASIALMGLGGLGALGLFRRRRAAKA